MEHRIVYTASGLTIFGGGRITQAQISQAVKLAPVVVAADKGAVTACKAGTVPVAVIGDMDGDPSAITACVPLERIYKVEEQDSTDFEKCLNAVEAPFILALGVTGSRLDHSLAAFNALAQFSNRLIIILSGKDICFLSPSVLRLDLPVGTRISLFPLAPVCGHSAGLLWPIEGLEFSPTGRIGTSNRTTKTRVELRFDHRHMLVILPRKHLGAVLSQLAS